MCRTSRSALMRDRADSSHGVTDAGLLYHLRGELGTDVLAVIVSGEPASCGRPLVSVAVCDASWSQRRLTGADGVQLDLFVLPYQLFKERCRDMESYADALSVVSTGRLIYDPLRIGASLQRRASDRLREPRRALSESERCDRILSAYDALALARTAVASRSLLAVPLAHAAAMECLRLVLRDANVWPIDLVAKLDGAVRKDHPVASALESLQKARDRPGEMLDALDTLERAVTGRDPSDAVVRCFGTRRPIRAARPQLTNRRVRADVRA
jgi:hypothetical protein